MLFITTDSWFYFLHTFFYILFSLRCSPTYHDKPCGELFFIFLFISFFWTVGSVCLGVLLSFLFSTYICILASVLYVLRPRTFCTRQFGFCDDKLYLDFTVLPCAFYLTPFHSLVFKTDICLPLSLVSIDTA